MRNELQAAVEYFEYQLELVRHYAEGYPDKDNYTAIADIYATALTALRDMLKRREGCDFCNESEQIQNQYGDIMGMDEGVLILDTEGYPGVTFRIKYCPDCGRELSGNAEQVKEADDD